MYSRFFIAVFLGIILLSQTIAIGYSQWTDYNEHDPGTTAIMPDWFKNNAKWWKDGLISDADMVNALESLMVQDIIPLDKFVKPSSGVEHEAGVQKGGDFFIPAYQKDVFGFWGDGIVSDSEIVNSIGHLMSQGIINSDKIQEKRVSFAEAAGLELETPPIDYRDGDEITHTTKNPGIPKYGNINFKMGTLSPELLESIFETAKQNELSMTYLQKIKSAEYDLIKNAYDLAISDYSKNKDQTTMNTMNSLGIAEKNAKTDSQRALEIHKKAVELAKQAKDNAVSSGLHVLDLEKKVSDKQLGIDSMKNIKTESEIKSAYKDAQKSQKLANQGMQSTLLSAISDSPEYQNLSPSEKNYVSAEINDIEYSDFRVISTTNDLDKKTTSTPQEVIDDFQYEGQAYVLLIDLISNEDGAKSVLDVVFGEQRDYLSEDSIAPPGTYSKFLFPLAPDSNSNFYVILGADHEIGDSLTDPSSSSVDEGWVHRADYYFNTIALPGGNTFATGFQFPDGALTPLVNSETIAADRMILDGYEYCPFCGEEKQNASDENCINCGLVDEHSYTTHDPGYETSSDGDSCPSSCLERNSDGICIVCGDADEHESEIAVGGNDEYVSDENYDEGTTTTYPDGTTMTTYSDGKVVYVHPDGTIETKFPNGDEEIVLADGTIQNLYGPNDIVETISDGFTDSGEVYWTGPFVNYYSGIWTLIVGNERHTFDTRDYALNSLDELIELFKASNSPQSSTSELPSISTSTTSNDVFVGVSTTDSEGSIITTYPDGTTHTLFTNGISYTLYPDGTSYQRFPHNESTRTLYPDGTFYTLYPDGTFYANNYQDYESATGYIFVDTLINYEYQKWQAQISSTIYYFDSQSEMNDTIWEMAIQDMDKDGIDDSIDTNPNVSSNEFSDSESSTTGKILDNAGHTIKITKIDGSVQIEVGTDGGNDPAVIEILGVEMELEPGTILDANFG